MSDDSTRIYACDAWVLSIRLVFVDPDTMSIIMLINEMISSACNKHTKGDENFELTIQP